MHAHECANVINGHVWLEKLIGDHVWVKIKSLHFDVINIDCVMTLLLGKSCDFYVFHRRMHGSNLGYSHNKPDWLFTSLLIIAFIFFLLDTRFAYMLVPNTREPIFMCQFRKSNRKVGNTTDKQNIRAIYVCLLCCLICWFLFLGVFCSLRLYVLHFFQGRYTLHTIAAHKHDVCFHVCLIVGLLLIFSSALSASHPFPCTLFLYISASSSCYFVSLS